MKFEKINFKEKSSRRIYEDYVKRINLTTKSLSKEGQNEILMELNSHIYEGLQQNKNQNEIDRLLDVLEKLGAPEETLRLLIADKKMEQATRTFNPLHMFRALALNLGNGISYVIFFILYLMLFGFVFLIFSEIFDPQSTGLFFEGNNFQALGKISPDYLKGSGTREILGSWFIPAMLFAIVIFYLIITFLLKIKRKINRT